MLKNYLTLALRNIKRNKLYSFINILGLSIGVSACLVIFLIVNYEFSFDKFHPGGERIFRVYSQFSGDFKAINRGVPGALPEGTRGALTGIEAVSGFHTWNADVSVPDSTGKMKEFKRSDDLVIVAPDYFDIFKAYSWVAGSPGSSLSKPYQVALTESKARIYFGTSDPAVVLGKQIHYRDSLVLTVSGVLKDFKERSDFYFRDFVSFSTIEASWLKRQVRTNDWQSTNSSSMMFVRLAPAASIPQIEQGLDKLVTSHRDNDRTWIVNYHLQPLSDIHFNTETGIFNNGGASANKDTLNLLIIIAVLLLSIAAINFVNLETAQAVRRAKEVGVRKVMGSTRGKLIVHFLLQSTLMTVLAVIVAIPLSELAIQYFKDFIPAGVRLHFTDPFTIAFLFLSIVVVSFLAGLYPAFSLSSFLPAVALKNQISVNSHQTRSGFVRKSLIVFQFTFAQALIVATIIVGWQISFMINKDLGFSKDAIIYINTPWNLPHQKTVTLKSEIETLPEVARITLCADAPASNSYNSNTLKYNDGKQELHHNVYRKFGDTAFISVFNLKLIAGRNIHKSDSADEYIINETYAKLLGFQKPEDAIDKLLIADKKRYPIVGVVKDFNFQSLHHVIEPVVIADEEYNFNTIAIKVHAASGGDNLKNLTAKIETVWKKVYGDKKLDLVFFDESISRFYDAEKRTSKLINTATGVAVLISCLGLFGLASFTSVQRTKEIGIRKVLGASVGNIVLLLSREFALLVVIAFVLAAPAAWFGANGWLESFAYKTPIGWQIFGITIVASLVIVALSVSSQAFKAAVSDPVKALRYE